VPLAPPFLVSRTETPVGSPIQLTVLRNRRRSRAKFSRRRALYVSNWRAFQALDHPSGVGSYIPASRSNRATLTLWTCPCPTNVATTPGPNYERRPTVSVYSPTDGLLWGYGSLILRDDSVHRRSDAFSVSSRGATAWRRTRPLASRHSWLMHSSP